MNSKSKMILVAGLAVAAASIGIGMTGYAVVAAGNETTVQLAELSPADAIAERQKLMKGNGAAAKTIDAFVESGTGTADDVAKSAASIKEAVCKGTVWGIRREAAKPGWYRWLKGGKRAEDEPE